MKILITGGTGFIGGNLVRGLSEEHEILSPRHKELDLLDGKVVAEYVSKHKPDTVIHAAVNSALASDRDLGFERDLRMFVNVLRGAEDVERIIYFGSGAEYDKSKIITQVEESNGVSTPGDLYGLSKYLMNIIAGQIDRIVNLRLFGIYGPEEDYRFKFISNAIVKNLLGLPITIRQDVKFDYLWIEDLLPVVEHAMATRGMSGDYNVTPDRAISLSEIAKIINSVADNPTEIKILENGMGKEYTGNNHKLHKEIPDINFTSYQAGTERLYQHYKIRVDEIDKKSIQEDKFLRGK